MSGPTSELAHLFRTLNAPAAARALPGLAERAREESWSYEKFLQALLSSEVSTPDSHGGENRIKAARFPELDGVDFASWQYVPVAVDRDRDRGVSHELADFVDRDPGIEHL